MSIQSEVETRMREVLFQMNYLLEQDGMKALWFSKVKNLREMFLPDDFSKLSWDFIRQMKDQFTLRDWNAIWNYHTTHENEERELREAFMDKPVRLGTLIVKDRNGNLAFGVSKDFKREVEKAMNEVLVAEGEEELDKDEVVE